MQNLVTFSIHTLGCKLNFSESSDIARRLEEVGFGRSECPDFLLVNSCAVTAVAEKKVRNLVAHLHRELPDARIVVLGCYAALRPQEILKWPGVVATFGNNDKLNVIPFMQNAALPAAPPFFAAFSSSDRTRSFLKIQDGCDYHCTYCTVWKARGESRSDTIPHVLEEIRRIVSMGMKEVNLTGVNLGDFGRHDGHGFGELLEAIEAEGLEVRIRISSIEPNLLTEDIIQLAARSRIIMPHFHIPLQSPCNRVLGLMHRRYTREFFAEKVRRVKEAMPHACIAMDVIAGFPTETESEFEEGLQFLEQLPASYFHVFTYSRRPATPAAEMDGQVPPAVKKIRTNRLIELSDRKKWDFYRSQIGKVRPVLWESELKNKMMCGFTDNYVKLKTKYDASRVNLVQDIEIKEDMFDLRSE
ncbi:MAG: MiaB/RimO family radical SAM methylthiotransferase [Bacteroidales bacterium]|nr:MiaB/RimO family radical SAM methylthiotransferase [Bacteroidales bacterium]